VLEVRFVSASGRLVKAGGPVVKNVTGFDLCRLLVGSLGTLGLFAEVVLRCYPLPAVSQWYAGRVADPTELFRRLYRPSSVLWDGEQVWVLLEGHPADVADQATSILGSSFSETDGPPVLPVLPGGPVQRLSVAPTSVGRLTSVASSDPVVGCARANHPADPTSPSEPPNGQPGRLGQLGRWVAELGVGVVHAERPAQVAVALGVPWPPTLAPAEAAINAAVKARFDPDGRLNPGRQVPA
jgi:glycolate oxidase FAD binding subunit